LFLYLSLNLVFGRSLFRGQGWTSTKHEELSHFDNTGVPLKIVESHRPITDKDVPDADVVIASWWEMAEWVANLSEIKGAKVYFIQGHAAEFDHLPKERVKATYSLPMYKITISKWLVDLHKTRYGNADIAFIPNSVDTEQFNAPPRNKQTTPTIGMLYSTLPLKGCDISFKAFYMVAQKFPELCLVAFGTEKPSSQLPLPLNTVYTQSPAQKTIKDIYARCDVWLCGSWSEGFHLPPLEAMACYCPVVSTQVGGSIDIIEEGINGYLAPLGDSEELANHLIHILSLSNEKWRAMSDAAHVTATQYTWDDATERLEQALYTAVKRKKQGKLL